ncbi:hypothetical protein DMQ00_29435 [Klebsiella pneumoniae]|nr:hypothetical protein DMQ00_29435 [Klebsiella pneumoniae]HBX5216082.1 hypothetical protein [Klebsiella pneumoniae]
MLCHGTVCVVGKIRDLILQLSKSSIYSTKPVSCSISQISRHLTVPGHTTFPSSSPPAGDQPRH